MYLVHLFPFFITIPLTFISHSYIQREIFTGVFVGPKTENTTLHTPVSPPAIAPPVAPPILCIVPVATTDPIDLPEKSESIKNILNIVTPAEISEALANKNEVPVSETNAGIKWPSNVLEKIVTASNEILSLYRSNKTRVKDKPFESVVDATLSSYKDTVYTICYHLVECLLGLFMFRHTILGIYARIIAWKVSQATSFIASIPSKVHKKFSQKRLFVPVSDESETDISDSEFTDCSSNSNIQIVRDESLALLHHSEEKEEVIEVIENDDTVQTNGDDSETVDLTLDCNSESNEVLCSTPIESNSNINPEKFKEFLQEKSNRLGNLGISFDADGYIREDVDLTSPLSIKNMTMRNKLHLLF